MPQALSENIKGPKSVPSRTRTGQKNKPKALRKFEAAWLRTEPYLKIGFAVLAALISLLVYSSTVSSNGFASFPVDDSWIHLTFANTLASTGRFAYGNLNHTTSGSTSPLFTFLEAIFFIFIKDEFAVALITLVLAYSAATWPLFFPCSEVHKRAMATCGRYFAFSRFALTCGPSKLGNGNGTCDRASFMGIA